MKEFFKSICLYSTFFVAILFSCGQRKSIQKPLVTDANKITSIKFDPLGAVDIPFDSLFKSFSTIELQLPVDLKYKFLLDLVQTDSSLIGDVGEAYCFFDLAGRLIKEVGSSGDGSNSSKSRLFHHIDNESILTIYGTKWTMYGLNGSVLSEGHIPYKIYPRSFIPLNDSTWLFYNPRILPKSDTLRLWTTDRNFKIKKRYLFFSPDFPTGGMGFMKYIFSTSNGIYITDRVVDTIYRFTEKGVDPVYLFDCGVYKYYRKLEQREPDFNEVTCGIKLVSENVVLFEVSMNHQSYFIYHNRITKTTKTIKNITNGPDLINSWDLKGFDKKNRLYWRLIWGRDTLINDAAKRFGYADLLKRRKVPSYKANPIIIVTTLR